MSQSHIPLSCLEKHLQDLQVQLPNWPTKHDHTKKLHFSGGDEGFYLHK